MTEKTADVQRLRSFNKKELICTGGSDDSISGLGRQDSRESHTQHYNQCVCILLAPGLILAKRATARRVMMARSVEERRLGAGGGDETRRKSR